VSDVAVPEQIILPLSGEVVLANDAAQVAPALEHMRELKRRADHAINDLTKALEAISEVRGGRTIHLPDGGKAALSSPFETVYDGEELAEALREVGMPDDVLAEIVYPVVEWKVNGTRAKQAAKANPRYAAAIAAHSRQEPKKVYVELTGIRRVSSCDAT
jgi:signal recognition particle subunit SEC65